MRWIPVSLPSLTRGSSGSSNSRRWMLKFRAGCEEFQG